MCSGSTIFSLADLTDYWRLNVQYITISNTSILKLSTYDISQFTHAKLIHIFRNNYLKCVPDVDAANILHTDITEICNAKTATKISTSSDRVTVHFESTTNPEHNHSNTVHYIKTTIKPAQSHLNKMLIK